MTTRLRTNRRRAFTALLVLLPLGLTACASGPGAPSIGMKRASVDLSFTDKSIPLPPMPPLPQAIHQVITQAPAAFFIPPQTNLALVRPPIGVAPVCPKLNPYEAHSAPPVTPGVTTPIKAGTYDVVNHGRISWGSPTGGTPAYNQLYPVLTHMQISHVNEKLQPANPGTTVAGTTVGNSAAEEVGTYDVKEDLGNGSWTLSTYQLSTGSPSEIDLIKRVTHIAKTILTPATTVTFTPTPALKIMGFGKVATQWEGASVDPSTGAVGVVKGGIVAIQTVDVCGHAVNAFIVRSSERYVSVSSSGTVFQSETNDNVIDTSKTPTVDPNQVQGCPANLATCDPTDQAGQMNYYLVATQMGGLFVSEITHMTTTIPPLAITVNNVATLTSPPPKSKR